MKKHHLAEYQENRSEEGKRKVRDFIYANPLANLKDCAKATGFSYPTVIKYAKQLKAEANG